MNAELCGTINSPARGFEIVAVAIMMTASAVLSTLENDLG
jgi:hypothetical protein